MSQNRALCARPPSALAANLRRLLAQRGLTVAQVAKQCHLDQRTIRGIRNGSNKPHARSIRKLAKGLTVSIDELFLDPSLLVQRRFDRKTNPAVDEVVSEHPDLFEGWTEADFDELYSRVGSGSGLTVEGAFDAVRAANKKREVFRKVELLLESGQAKMLSEMVDVLYRSIAAHEQ